MIEQEDGTIKIELVRASDVTPAPRTPCPFCGETDYKARLNERRAYQVECYNCAARGPTFGDPQSALRAWCERRIL